MKVSEPQVIGRPQIRRKGCDGRDAVVLDQCFVGCRPGLTVDCTEQHCSASLAVLKIFHKVRLRYTAYHDEASIYIIPFLNSVCSLY